MTRIEPCPFCGGPPVTWVKDAMADTGELGLEDVDTTDGTYCEALVHCHECGARGPYVDDIVYDAEGMAALTARSVDLWNQRDTRHADLYAAGEAEGLNMYPRAAPDGVTMSASEEAAMCRALRESGRFLDGPTCEAGTFDALEVWRDKVSHVVAATVDDEIMAIYRATQP